MSLPSHDETFHPNDGNPYWNESAWFSFLIPEREMNGWIYYSWGIASEKDSFCIGSMAESVLPDGSLPAGPDRLTFGYYMRDGVVSDVTAGTVRVLERDRDGRPLELTLTATDQSGRSLTVNGTGVAWLRFPGLTFIAYWWVMVRWQFDGRSIFGEVQDGWPMQEFRRYVRASKG